MNETQGPFIYDLPDILSNICGLVGITIFVYKLIRILKSGDTNEHWVNGIWFFGLIAFLIRLAGQMYSIGNMFRAVSDAGQPDINAVAGELSRTTLNSLKGLIILTTLLILWGLVRGLITNRKTKEVQVHKR
jgi:beta-lactamase regulating signal transducer with metallopeptidase domain